MIRTGQPQDLIVLRRTGNGVFLGDGDDAEVMLPNVERPDSCEVGSTLHVFVYRDHSGRHMASMKMPKAQVGEFAQLQVKSVAAAGAMLDWGLGTELFIPAQDQRKKLEEGRWYVVRVALDERSDRVYGSTRIEQFLSNENLTVKAGDEVSLLVFERSPLGLSVIVNNTHQGLVHANEIFRPVSIGDRIAGFVKQVREDNKLDITLQPIGYRKAIDPHTALLTKRLQSGSGFLPLTDKSSAEEIHQEFGISKKAFKKALGALYKDRKVRIEEEGIIWIG